MKIKRSRGIRTTRLRFSRPTLPHLLLLIALVVLLAFELFSLAYWTAYPYFSTAEQAADLEQSTFNILSLASPALLIGVLYLALFRVLLPIASRTASGRLEEFKHELSRLPIIRLRTTLVESQNIFGRKLSSLLLSMTILAGALIVYAPYRPDINLVQRLVGIDTPVYLGWLVQMTQRPFSQAVAYSFGTASEGSRPLFLLILYAFSSSGIGPDQLVKFFPMLMSPLLALSIFLFVKTGLGSSGRDTALISAILAIFSFDITVGMWAGFYANWFAMILSYVFFAILMSYLRSPKRIVFSIMIVGTALALFLVHPWTWLVVLSVAMIFTLSLRTKLKTNLPSLVVTAALGLGFFTDYLERLVVGGTTLASDLATKSPVFGLNQLLLFPSNLTTGLFGTYGGLLSNTVIFLSSLIAVPFMRFGNRFHRLLIVWVAVGSLVFPFFDSFHQTRVLYDLPFPVLSAVGILAVVSGTKRMRLVSLLIISIILVVNANYALRSMFQL